MSFSVILCNNRRYSACLLESGSFMACVAGQVMCIVVFFCSRAALRLECVPAIRTGDDVINTDSDKC